MKFSMPVWLAMTLTEEERATLVSGRAITRDGKVYAACAACHRVIRVNKPIIGSAHLCEPE